MLCCVSRRAVAGADLGPPYDHKFKVQPVESEKVVQVEQYTEPDVQDILLPCAFCLRTFKPQSLEKHSKICKRITEKRTPFDSAKQRIQGTELAEFLPKQEKKRSAQDDRSKPSTTWKQNHDNFLRTIRAARDEVTDFTMQKQCGTTVTPSAPTRSNEQGMCPTCNRHFGVKAYERHVAWCKDRVTHVPVSPATNIAKERLEARMKYRAPAVKSRRQATREKYSPGSAITLNSASKTSPTIATVKAKESASAPNCNKNVDIPVKQKSFVRRSGQPKESPAAPVPMKSRPIDRPNRPPEDKPGPLSFRPAPPVKRTSYLPVPPLRHTKETLEECESIPSAKRRPKVHERPKREEISHRSKQEEKHSARSPKTNIVSARSQGNPKVNDVSINDDIVGITVKPCNIYKEDAFVTWKQISQEKKLEPAYSQKSVTRKIKSDIDADFRESSKDSFETSKYDDKSKNLNWSTVSLNQTYSFKDLNEVESLKISKGKWKPVKHSPRVEFCLGDLEKASRLRATYFTCPEPSVSSTSLRKSSKDTVENNMEDLKSLESRSKILEKKRLTSDLSVQNDANSVNDYPTSMKENVELSSNCDQTQAEDIQVADVQDWSETIKRMEQKLECNEFNAYEPCTDEINEPSEMKLQEKKHSSDQMKMKNTEDQMKNTEDIEENELHSDVQSIDQSLQNETESTQNYMDEDTKSCNTNCIEMDNDQISKDILPTRSSTPFEYSEPKSPPQVENSEWKMAVNVKTGSELLYRVESRDSNSSSHTIRKSRRRNSENTLQSNCSTPREISTGNKSFSSLPSIRIREGESYSPATPKNREFDSQKTFRKDIASQINMCNCSSSVFSIPKYDKGIDCSDLSGNIFESEAEFGNVQSTSNLNGVSSLEESKVEMKESNENLEESKTEIDAKDNLSKESNEEIQEIYKSCAAKDFDEDSDNSVEQHMREAINNLKASNKHRQYPPGMRSIILSESRVKKKTRSTTSKMYRSKILETSKIHENMDILNESSDSLSSINEVNFTDMRRVESVEVETIEEIGTRNRSIKFRILPEIKGMVVKKNCEREKIDPQSYWDKATRTMKNRLINLDPPYQGASRFFKRNPKVGILPPVPSGSSLIDHRNFKLPLRPVWSNYVRRRPDFNLVLSGRTGKDYNPFLLAEQQMNDLLSDTSEQSVTDSPSIEQNRETSFPLSHSSAFVKYPCQSSLSSPEKRSSLIAPPTEFDDLVSDFSSDSTETNSLSREIFLKDMKDLKELKESKSDVDKKSPVRELGRRVIIDKSKALGGEVVDGSRGSRSFVGNSEKARKILDKVSPKVIRPSVNRSLSVRASSAPKTTPDRKTDDSKKSRKNDAQRCNNSLNNRNNNYANLSSSNLSLSSIVSSDMDIKRSNSLFDELMTSFEDENGSFSSLKSLLKNDSLSMSSPVHGRQRNGQISDDELSSPESYKRQDHSKMSADSAYSSLNRKYSHHGRSTNDVAGRLEEDLPRCNRRDGDGMNNTKYKMSKYCHECGSRFPETAKFCCECGVRRLVL
ncbi:uncharacterized protein LOC143264336 isoform X3 [Megachile rotundata]|uniref:uncharacterized protein LOC143264336 isoform X3 n=1 Tax=Megachile rotundata TaxID=143995 RepID=UPI003FCEE786